MSGSRGRTKEKNGRRNSRKVANMESTSCNEQVASNEVPTFNSRVGITVYSYRARTCDPDGVSCKAAIDGIVSAGVLRDDSAKEVAWIHYPSIIKVKNTSEEKTVIVIEET